MTEPIRTVYRQIRRNLPAHAEVMEMVEQIAIAPGSANHALPPGAITGNGSYLAKIQKQAEALRIAFNRLYFIQCNLMKFSMDELKSAEKAFEKLKKILDTKEASPLNNMTTQVEKYLADRRYFFIWQR